MRNILIAVSLLLLVTGVAYFAQTGSSPVIPTRYVQQPAPALPVWNVDLHQVLPAQSLTYTLRGKPLPLSWLVVYNRIVMLEDVDYTATTDAAGAVTITFKNPQGFLAGDVIRIQYATMP